MRSLSKPSTDMQHEPHRKVDNLSEVQILFQSPIEISQRRQTSEVVLRPESYSKLVSPLAFPFTIAVAISTDTEPTANTQPTANTRPTAGATDAEPTTNTQPTTGT